MDRSRPDNPSGPDAPKLIAPADRERAIARLGRAFADDVLTVEDYESRLSAVYAARSESDLAETTRDLPQVVPEPVRAPALERTGPPLPGGQGPTIQAVFSSVARRAPAVMPQRQEIRAVFGNVELDYTATEFPEGVTEISVMSAFGNIELTLPWDADVENAGSAVLGNFDVHVRTKHADLQLPGRPRIRITGYAILGNVEIRTAPRPKV